VPCRAPARSATAASPSAQRAYGRGGGAARHGAVVRSGSLPGAALLVLEPPRPARRPGFAALLEQSPQKTNVVVSSWQQRLLEYSTPMETYACVAKLTTTRREPASPCRADTRMVARPAGRSPGWPWPAPSVCSRACSRRRSPLIAATATGEASKTRVPVRSTPRSSAAASAKANVPS
jgi:hypothetical protein